MEQHCEFLIKLKIFRISDSKFRIKKYRHPEFISGSPYDLGDTETSLA